MDLTASRRSIRNSIVIHLFLLICVQFACIGKIQSSIHVLERTTPNSATDIQICEVIGTVFDENKKPLPGTTVKITSDQGDSFEVYTRENGNFSFTNLVPGIYSVEASLGGFQNVKREKLILTNQSSTQLEITMACDPKNTFTVT